MQASRQPHLCRMTVLEEEQLRLLQRTPYHVYLKPEDLKRNHAHNHRVPFFAEDHRNDTPPSHQHHPHLAYIALNIAAECPKPSPLNRLHA